MRDFVADAFAHCKFIGVGEAAQPLLNQAGITPDGGILPVTDASTAAKFLEACRRLRYFEREGAGD